MVLVFGLTDGLFGQAGALDASFGFGGIATTSLLLGYDKASSVAIQADGKIVVGGTSQNGTAGPGFTLARYNADGDLDLDFGAAGVVTSNFGGSSWANAIAIQPDGKIVAVGVLGYIQLAIARYNVDGTLDDGFGLNGLVTDSVGFPVGGLAVAIQPDGKIVAAGGGFFARYDINGIPDSSFAGDGIIEGIDMDIRSIAVQQDGKIVAVGSANFDQLIARFNADGTMDNSFGLNGFINHDFSIANAVGLQTDMKIVVAGHQGWGNFVLSRYNPDGMLDSTFASVGTVSTDFGSVVTVNAIALLPDGKIVAAGRLGIFSDFALASYNPDGSLDNGFGLNGKLTTDFGGGNDEASSLALQPDGKIIAVGNANFNIDSDFALARYTPNGALDVTFGLGGIVSVAIGMGTATVTASVLQPDGKILMAGSILHGAPGYGSEDFFNRFIMVRYNEDGTLDASFGSGGIYLGFIVGEGFDYGFSVNALAIQADGNILVGITSFYHPGMSSGGISRFFPDGTPDTVSVSFPSCAFCFSGVNALAVQPDGKIIAGGQVNSNFVLARNNPDGTFDEDFGLEGVLEIDFGGYEAGSALAVQPNGSIVIAGETTQNNSIALARCTPEGILDNNFGNGGKVISPDFGGANDVALQPDGKIVVGGNLVLARYETNGALDNSFGFNGKVDLDFIAHSLTLQPDGKILATGIGVLARFNSDGTLDGAFGAGGMLITRHRGIPVNKLRRPPTRRQNRRGRRVGWRLRRRPLPFRLGNGCV
ncbi:MAG: hypothetical protein IPN76_03605 [Saprospiraceae bacterium]|nr:hypothetical protein [Saprospiraceae bacterium]